MSYNPGASNRFGFNATDTNYEPSLASGATVSLSPTGTGRQIVGSSAGDIVVELPNPALCNEQIREIICISGSTRTVQVVQYAASGVGSAIALPGLGTNATSGKLSTTASDFTSSPKVSNYNSAVYVCNGSTWILASANLNAQY